MQGTGVSFSFVTILSFFRHNADFFQKSDGPFRPLTGRTGWLPLRQRLPHATEQRKKTAAALSDRRSRFSAPIRPKCRTCSTSVKTSLKQFSWLTHPQPPPAFSNLCSMTDFRPWGGLRAYSGGTARDLHPILYAPSGLLPTERHSSEHSLFVKKYSIASGHCQGPKAAPGPSFRGISGLHPK